VAALAFLTDRQRDIVILVSHGKSVLYIAEQLGLSIKTVEAHKYGAYRRLGVHRVAELVHRLYELGAFSPEHKEEMSEELKAARPLQPHSETWE
jgi:DNA-binding CsgD family transcriptional regulator